MEKIKKLRVTTGHYHIGHRRPVKIAMVKGWFKEEGLEVNLFPMGTWDDHLTLQALLDDKVDIVMDPHSDIVIDMSSKGMEVCIIGGFRNSFPYVLFGDKEIDSFEKLKGKKVGVHEPDGIAARHIKKALRLNGLEPDKDVIIVSHSGKPPQQPDALKSGKIDTAQVALYDYKKMVEEGYPVLIDFNKMYPYGYPDRVIVSTHSKVDRNPEAIKIFMNGIVRAFRFILKAENFEELVKISRMILDEDISFGGERAEESKKDWPSVTGKDGSYSPHPPDGNVNIKGLELVIEEERKSGRISKTYNLKTVLRTEFVEEAAKEVDEKFGRGNYE